MKTKFLTLLLIGLFTFTGCGDDDDDVNAAAAVNCANFASDLSDEIQAVSDALTAFISDQSVANCNAYLDALDDYLTAVEPYVEQCGDDEDFADFKEAIEEFRETRDQQTCS